MNLVPSSLPSPDAGQAGMARPQRVGRPPYFRTWRDRFDPVRLALFTVILVNITDIHAYFGPLASLRPALLSMLVSGLAVLLSPALVRWSNVTQATVIRVLFVFLVFVMGSAVFGLSSGSSLLYIVTTYWKILFIFFLLVASVRDTKDLAFLVWAFVISIAVLVILANSGISSFSTTNTGLARLAVLGMYDSNDIGMLLLMGLPLGFLFLFNSGPVGRIISLIVIAGVPASIALTGSRGALVGLVVVGPFLFLALSRINFFMRLGSIAVIIAALNWAAPAGYWEQMETILNPSEDYNLADTNYGRVALAKRGLGYMYDYPIFGVGINNFARAEGTISWIAQTAMAGAQIQWIAPHNTYVQVGAEVGFFGLVAWLTLLWAGTIGLLWLRRKIPKSWEMQSAERRFLREACLFIPLSVLAFASTSFFLSHAYTAPFYYLLVFIAATHLLVNRELAADAARAQEGRVIQPRQKEPVVNGAQALPRPLEGLVSVRREGREQPS